MVRGPQVRAFFYQVQRAIGHGHSGELSEVFPNPGVDWPNDESTLCPVWKPHLP